MPTLRQLEYLIALSEEKHFRKAAERMRVTQPTLSAQLQELERTLDASLIDRSARRVTFTPLGNLVLEKARAALATVKDIVDLSSAAQHGFHGTIKIGVPPTLGAYLLPHIVPALHERYPDLKLYVREAKPDDLKAQLQSGTFDLIISPLPINHSDLTVEPIFREPLMVVCAPDHALADYEQINRQQLAGENVLTIEPGHHLHDKVRELCDDFGANLLRDYEGTSLDTLRLMVGMGVGIAFLPSLYIRSEIGARGQLRVLKMKETNLHRQVGIAWRRTSVQASLFGELVELVREIAAADLPEITVLR